MSRVAYSFEVEGEAAMECVVDVEREANTRLDGSPRAEAGSGATTAPWLHLDQTTCEPCPGRPAERTFCPALRDLAEVAPLFDHLQSYERAKVVVSSGDRTITADVPIYDGLRSLFGLILATGQCPVLGRFKGLARYHLPFATLEETLFRTVGAYLIACQQADKLGATDAYDLTPLKTFYRDVRRVNEHLTEHLQDAAKSDSSINALVSFFGMSNLFEVDLDGLLEDLAHRFASPTPLSPEM